MSELDCFCCSQKKYAQCCQPFHLGQQQAPTAEALMRSRYSAYCSANVNYLFTTLHPRFRQADELEQLKNSMGKTEWLGLKIINHTAEQVEFVAFYRTDKVEQLHERSNFIREENRWFYTSGMHLPAIKLNRNDVCYCGSSLKYKKCCGAQ